MDVLVERMSVGTVEAPSKRERASERESELVAVVIFNDDVTFMGYVVEVLVQIFGLGAEEGRGVMMMAHSTGSALVGLYDEDDALSRLKALDARNRINGERLRCVIVDL